MLVGIQRSLAYQMTSGSSVQMTGFKYFNTLIEKNQLYLLTTIGTNNELKKIAHLLAIRVKTMLKSELMRNSARSAAYIL